jgi:hypothetical protein
MRSLLALLVPIGLLAAAPEPTLWQYIHPDAKLLMGIDLLKAKTSPTGKMLAKQFQSVAGAQVSGTEFLEMADRILASSPGAEQGTHPAMVVAVEGRMDRARLRKMLAEGTAVERYRGVDLLVPPKRKNTDMLMAIVSDKIGLMGDRASIEQALDSGARRSESPLIARAQELAANNEIWLVSTVSPAAAAGDMLPGPKQLEDVDSMDLGLNLQQGLGLNLVLGMKSDEAAQSLAAMAQAFTVLASQNSKQNPQMAQLVKSLKIQSDKSNVRVSMQVTLAQLERGVTEMRAGMQTTGKRTLDSLIGAQPSANAWPSGLTASAPVTPKVVAAEPPVPKTRTIKIVGLDNGEKEITYTTGAQRP